MSCIVSSTEKERILVIEFMHFKLEQKSPLKCQVHKDRQLIFFVDETVWDSSQAFDES